MASPRRPRSGANKLIVDKGPGHCIRWAVAAPFFAPELHAEPGWRWLDDFVSSERHVFTKIAARADWTGSWHARRTTTTPLHTWVGHFRQALASHRLRPDGFISVFPQLATCIGAQKIVRRGNEPLLAWCFNVGARPPAAVRAVAKWALRGVDCFVVHSRAEIPLLTDWFDIPSSKIQFVHLQRAAISTPRLEVMDRPYIVAMGSANRDYATLIRAVEGTGIPTIIVAAPRLLADLPRAPNVTMRSRLSAVECLELAAGARLSVVTLADVETASGQVTVIEAMRVGCPVVATRSAGTLDYLVDGETGVLVDPGDPGQLRRVLLELWEDPMKRGSLAARAAMFADEHLSDEAAARSLTLILDKLTGTSARRFSAGDTLEVPAPLSLEGDDRLPGRVQRSARNHSER